MPIYHYICNACGKNFDLLIGVTSEKTKLQCIYCDSKKISKSFAAFSVGSSHAHSKRSEPRCEGCPNQGCGMIGN
ncbi:MAG: zinc ribbon domain-containing protein [Chlamydiota bacterium]|nr:zinc ribbon domain-containing protein [Chlamydiota bacterium]